jgi:hypothetical protein
VVNPRACISAVSKPPRIAERVVARKTHKKAVVEDSPGLSVISVNVCSFGRLTALIQTGSHPLTPDPVVIKGSLGEFCCISSSPWIKLDFIVLKPGRITDIALASISTGYFSIHSGLVIIFIEIIY